MKDKLIISCNIVDETRLGDGQDISIIEEYQTGQSIPVQITYSSKLEKPYIYDSDPPGQDATYYFAEVPLTYFSIIETWKSYNSDFNLTIGITSNIPVLTLNFISIQQ